MDIAELEETLFAATDAKLHGGMCKLLSDVYCQILTILPNLEAARPRSKSGLQALCSLHIALEKAKNVLQYCSESSKLYLAITGDSVLSKFEKARSALVDSLMLVEDIVPKSIGSQILEIVKALKEIKFPLDPLEKQVGDEIIALLQQGKEISDTNDSNELEAFHRAATRLNITSSKAALTERRALKKLLEKARVEEDKRKESIVSYLLHLMRKYSKLFRSDLGDDNDSSPCSPTQLDGCSSESCQAFDRQFSKLCFLNSKSTNKRPPEEMKCPISLQIMYDPVIIASGQTYERICIEKWFSDGHDTCPKTQQKLAHLSLLPNYCAKGLIANWCEQNGVHVPDKPPGSSDHNYWTLALSQFKFTKSKKVDCVDTSELMEVKVIPLEESTPIEEIQERENLKVKCKVVEQIRALVKNNEEARGFLGNHGFVEALLHFLELAVHESNTTAQEIGAMALFNLAVNNNRNKELMLEAKVIPLLEKMISDSTSCCAAAALYLNLSCLEVAKSIIGSSQAIPILVQLLQGETSPPQCKQDALHTLYNLSTAPSNVPYLLSAGIINGLTVAGGNAWTEKSIAVLLNLACTQAGKDKIISTPGLISGLVQVMDDGEPLEQEQAVACVLLLCIGNEKCIQMVLQEGVIPALVSISVNGTTRGRDKAQKLLMMFKGQRQRDHPPPEKHYLAPGIDKSKSVSFASAPPPVPAPPMESKPLYKSFSTRKMGRAFSLFWKNKSYSVSQY
ncbi:hypothetical protein ACFE04_023735 [Oxalis oulophora]